MILAKIIFIAIITMLLGIIISTVNKEFKLYLTLIFGILAVFLIFYEIKDQLVSMIGIFGNYDLKIENFSILIKIVVIAYICDFISLICKDLDYESIGKKIEMSGKLIILVYSFDVILQFIDEVLLLVNR